MGNSDNTVQRSDLKQKIHEVIFEAETREGKLFDEALFVAIILSVIVVILETTESVQAVMGNALVAIEWILTIFFTIEYGLRLYSVSKPLKYATSFYGIVDLLAILPTYLGLIIGVGQPLIVIRVLRLLRIFRVFKLFNYMYQGKIIVLALRRSSRKILVFILFILLVVIIIGAIMYIVEGPFNDQYDSIGRSIYWAIVTLTTVGYGDISPVTTLGQMIAAVVMLLGYAVIAVPTGIVTAEFARKTVVPSAPTRTCSYCGSEGHLDDANFCQNCGVELDH